MAKKYISKTGGSYELTRSAKAYDADEKASEKERSGNGGKRQRVESKGKLNLSADAASIFSPDEIKTLEEKAGKTTVSTGGGDPLPPGSKDNEFIVAKNKEEAEKIREQVGEDVAVRLEQNRNPKTGEFAENNKKLGDESGNEKDQSENN